MSINRFMWKRLFTNGFAALFYLSASMAALAADKPNFAGNWTLDASASKLQTSPKSASLAIKHQDPNLEVTTTSGDLKDTRSYKLDGIKRKLDISGIEMEISGKFEDSSLHTSAEGAGIKQLETWKLLDGGKTLQLTERYQGWYQERNFSSIANDRNHSQLSLFNPTVVAMLRIG